MHESHVHTIQHTLGIEKLTKSSYILIKARETKILNKISMKLITIYKILYPYHFQDGHTKKTITDHDNSLSYLQMKKSTYLGCNPRQTIN